MTKRYLIRRDLETFLGPFDVKELTKAYQRMDFGLQDEVSGSFGAWVTFDDLEKIERHYPELLDVVKNTMLGGWGFSQNSATRIIDKKTTGSRKTSSKHSSNYGSILTIAILVVAAGSAYYLARHSHWGSKLWRSNRDQPAEQFEELLKSGDKASFIMKFKNELATILNDAKKSRENLSHWLPSIRAYAFLTEGYVPGVPARIVKGAGFDQAPDQCTSEFWRRQWRQAKTTELDQFTSGYPENTKLDMWQKLLLWDPYWIAKRSSYDNWIYPKNYYHGCLIIAERAFSEIFPLANDRGQNVEKINERLVQLLAISDQLTKGSSQKQSGSGLMGTLACLDSARTSTHLDSCSDKKNVPETWQKYMYYREAAAKVRIGIDALTQTVSDSGLQELARKSFDINRSDIITGMSYRAESRFVRSLLRNGGDVNKAIHETKYEHRNVNVLIAH